MRGLLVKDFQLLFQRKQTIIIFLAVCLLMGFSTDGSFVVGYMSFLSAIFAISTISYDEADNGMLFLMTLPVERNTYVRSKYILGAVFCVPAWIFSVVVVIVISLIKGAPVDIGNTLANAVLMLPLCAFVLDLMVPLQLKYGIEKSRMVMFIVWGGITAVCLLVGKTFGKTEAARNLAASFDRIPAAAVLAALILLCVILTFVSIRSSERIMKNKTF